MKREKTSTSFGVGGQSGAARRRAFGIDTVVSRARRQALEELYRFWEGSAAPDIPDSEDEARRRLRAWMSDSGLIEARVRGLGRRLGAVLEELMGSPRYRKTFAELAGTRSLSYLSEYDLEACLSALERFGFVLEGDDESFDRQGDRVIGVPVEMAEALRTRRSERMNGVFGVLTLRGHLEQVYSSPEKSARMTPQRLRGLYKMYAQESASAARIERLPDGVRGLVEKAILEFGGFLPRQLFERMRTSLPHWNGRRWRMILEQSLIGTVRELDLSPYGIRLQDECLLVFNEVSLAWLRRVAVPGDPDRPHEELSLGIDLISNISRFLNYIEENGVRFTVRGEIFKTTEKKILHHLIPNPGRELSREEVLRFVFRFCKRSGLIDRTGKRTFRVSADGKAWGNRPLAGKQKALLEYMREESPVDGERFHQVRIRAIFMRLLKRLEPGTWYDLMYLPFLARNNYLSTLDDLGVAEHFEERTKSGRFNPLEDPQRMAWNLAQWIRQRLYLLGVVDLGYDAENRPVAMRLSLSAARLLGIDRIGPVRPRRVGSLVVTPDFQVVLFPTGDDVELIHDLDRFCHREKVDSVFHFKIEKAAVLRALREGMELEDIHAVLDQHSRTPVPQNVTFSIRDWALRAGVMRLSEDLVLVCEEPEVLKAFLQDPGARRYIARRLDERSVQLEGKATPKRLRALLRELGYLVELGGPIG
ncbi:MAG TPA: hypothetical protein ENJ09_09760 [Planctomycetes bacterium]|nr:hypothetical protein [Planctomycetota bacterium]